MSSRSGPTVPPHLAACLQAATDPCRAGERIAAHWQPEHWFGARLMHCTVHRVFPRGQARFIVKYHLRLQYPDGRIRDQVAFGEIAPGEVRQRATLRLRQLKKTRRGQIPKGVDCSPAITAIPEWSMVLVLEGYDEKLPGLILHHQPARAAEYLSRFTATAVAEPHSEILNHRLGKRCILRLDDGGHAVVIRCLKPTDGRHRQNRQVMQRLRTAGLDGNCPAGVSIPRLLHVDETLAVVTLEHCPGETLHDAIQWPPEHKARIAARAIAGLHALPLRVPRLYSSEQELEMLGEWTRFTGNLKPELGERLTTALQQLSARFRGLEPVPFRPCHRDFYEKQVLYDGDRITLIDFDTLTMADPALDLGNHLAHRRFYRLFQEKSSLFSEEREVFLDQYDEFHPLPPQEHIIVWEQAALLRLVCLYAFNSDYQRYIPLLLRQLGEF